MNGQAIKFANFVVAYYGTVAALFAHDSLPRGLRAQCGTVRYVKVAPRVFELALNSYSYRYCFPDDRRASGAR
eukprot:scaffold357525_cov48-Prasinocladus_malaysianus.AAC.1